MRLAMPLLLAAFACLAMAGTRAWAADKAASFVPPPGAHGVTVVSHDYQFDMPATLPAGLTRFVLRNDGKQWHHLMLARLGEGKTLADFMQAMSHPGGPLPAWVQLVGGPNAAFPGESTNATLVLAAGHYVAFCVIPAPDGKPHLMHGMVRPFTVTAAPGKVAALPGADLHITLTDYDFKLSKPITPGRHVIAVSNQGSQPHEMVIVRFSAGQGVHDLEAWGGNPHGLPAPGHAMGGITDMAPGLTAEISVDFPPGHYGLVCFVPDAKDGRPHFMHGMQKEFVVR